MAGFYYTNTYAQPKSADLPEITMTGYDDAGSEVVMTLSPESGVSSSEVSKLLMLIVAIMGSGSGVSSFNPLAYVKKHNLERHFTFK